MTKLSLTQQKNIIENAILNQSISLKYFENMDYTERNNPQIVKIERYLKGEVDTLQAVLDMLNGNTVMINLLVNPVRC
jgi:hypothetical protein